MPIQVRQIAEPDVTALVEVWNASKKDAYPFLSQEQSRTVAEDLAFYRQHLAGRCRMWVAEDDGGILGFMALEGNYLDRLYVAPARQSRGVGAALLEKAKRLCPQGLRLHTHQKNHAARRFYEKHGFVAVKFGLSPAPENEPDVEYHWKPRGHRDEAP